MRDPETSAANPVPLDYAGEPEATRYRRRYRRTLAVAVALAAALAVVAGVATVRLVQRYRAQAARAQAVALRVVPVTPAPRTPNQAVTDAVAATPPPPLREPAYDRLMAGPPAGTVVYEEHPAAAVTLADRDVAFGRWNRVSVAGVAWNRDGLPFEAPAGFIWTDVYLRRVLEAGDPPLFVAARTSPDGTERLVGVFLTALLRQPVLEGREPKLTDGLLYDRRLWYGVYAVRPHPDADRRPDEDPRVEVRRSDRSLRVEQPGDAGAMRIEWVGGSRRSFRDEANALRFLAGTPNPADASRFKIPYELGPPGDPWHRGEIRGRLLDGDLLELTPTTGDVSAGSWTLPAKPDDAAGVAWCQGAVWKPPLTARSRRGGRGGCAGSSGPAAGPRPARRRAARRPWRRRRTRPGVRPPA